MSQMDWPTVAWRFLSDLQKRIESRVEAGWPAGFEPAGKFERDNDEVMPSLTIKSWKQNPSRWYDVDCSVHDGGRAIVQVCWYSESDRQIKALAKKVVGYMDGYYLAAGDRLFSQYLCDPDKDYCYFTAFLVGPETLASEQFVEEIATVFLALVEKVTSLGVR